MHTCMQGLWYWTLTLFGIITVYKLCKGWQSAHASRNHHGHDIISWAALISNTSGLMDNKFVCDWVVSNVSGNCTPLTSDLTNLHVPEW